MRRGVSATDRIFAAVRELAGTGAGATVKIADVLERCIDKGFKPDQVPISLSFLSLGYTRGRMLQECP